MQKAIEYTSPKQTSRLVQISQDLELVERNLPPKQEKIDENIQALRRDLKRVEETLKR